MPQLPHTTVYRQLVDFIDLVFQTESYKDKQYSKWVSQVQDKWLEASSPEGEDAETLDIVLQK